MDENRNKALDWEEFDTGLKDWIEQQNSTLKLTEEERRQLFASFDKDGSGTVRFDEFLQALRVSKVGCSEDGKGGLTSPCPTLRDPMAHTLSPHAPPHQPHAPLAQNSLEEIQTHAPPSQSPCPTLQSPCPTPVSPLPHPTFLPHSNALNSLSCKLFISKILFLSFLSLNVS